MGDSFRVPSDGSFRISAAPTSPPASSPDRKVLRTRLADAVERIGELQRRLWAEDRRAMLVIFQAMDAAGKDSTIRAVFSAVNPTGIRVHSFKAPTPEELDHDFLWRSTLRLPERGQMGVFNRSYYEEVLIVRVHPDLLESQRLPGWPQAGARRTLAKVWEERFRSIRDHERHLVENGTTIVKFWLHISPQEQHRRFLSRLDHPEKHWKFSERDVEERKHREAYLQAYEAALNETSTPYAPWYAVPADDKPFLKATVAEVLAETLETMDPQYPVLGAQEKEDFARIREALARQDPDGTGSSNSS